MNAFVLFFRLIYEMYAAGEVEELITCSVCLDKFTQPKVLPCGHTFCQSCLVGLSRHSGPTLDCPECRESHEVPEGNVTNFCDNLVIKNLLKMNQVVSGALDVMKCPVCMKNSILSGCNHCNQQICADCSMVHADLKHVEEAVKLLKSRVSSPDIIDKVKQSKHVWTESKSNLEVQKIHMENMIDGHIKELQNRKQAFGQFIDVLEKVQQLMMHSVDPSLGTDQLYHEIDEMSARAETSEERKKLKVECDEYLRAFEILAASNWLSNFQFTGDERFSLSARTFGRLKRGATDFLLPALHSSQLSFGSRTNSTVSASAAGTSSVADFVKPFTLKGKKSPVVKDMKPSVEGAYVSAEATLSSGERSAKKIRLSDDNRGPNRAGSDVTTAAVDAHSATSGTNEAAGGVVSSTACSGLLSDIEQPAPAPSRPTIRYENKNHGCPTIIGCGNAAGINKLCAPYGVTFCPNTNLLYVADTKRVMIYDTEGNWRGCWGREGGSGNQVDIGDPVDIACERDRNNMIITDNDSDECIIYNISDGSIERRFGGRGDGDGEFENIRGVACYGGNIFVVDQNAGRVSVFDSYGGYLRRFGARYLKVPQYITIGGPHNHVFVSDTERHDVCVFSQQGEFLRSFGKNDGAGATGITVDQQGYVSVCRPNASIVQVYRPDGELYCLFGRPGSSPGCLYNPVGMELLPDGRLAVSDNKNHRVQLF